MNTEAHSLIVGDAHVHFHRCFDPVSFIDAAYANFDRVVRQFAGGKRFTGMLLLTEGRRENGFERLLERLRIQQDAGDAGLGGWSVQHTSEDDSLVLTNAGQKTLIVISGRQVVSRDDLEVLAIGTRHTFPEDLAIEELIREVIRADALPIVPWGFGKWVGARGRRLKALIQNPERPAFFLGDNANRPAFLPLPALFHQAKEAGIRNVPGSDPLPFSSEQRRSGRSGFIIPGPIDLSSPASALKAKLSDPHTDLDYFGRGETPIRFARNQAAMHYRKRIKREQAIQS